MSQLTIGNRVRFTSGTGNAIERVGEIVERRSGKTGDFFAVKDDEGDIRKVRPSRCQAA